MHIKIVGGTDSLGAGETRAHAGLLGVWVDKGESDLFPHERLPTTFFTHDDPILSDHPAILVRTGSLPTKRTLSLWDYNLLSSYLRRTTLGASTSLLIGMKCLHMEMPPVVRRVFFI